MKYFVSISLLSVVLFSCSNSENPQNENPGKESLEYELLELDSFSFRRMYHGHDALKGAEWDVFMNRNPEPGTRHRLCKFEKPPLLP